MKIDKFEYFIHASDLLHILGLFFVVAATKYGESTRKENNQRKQSPLFGAPTLYIVAVCTGALIRTAGNFYPGNPHLAPLLKKTGKLQQSVQKTGNPASSLSVAIHMMTISEVAYEIVVSTLVFIITFSLGMRMIMNFVSHALSSRTRSEGRKSGLGNALLTLLSFLIFLFALIVSVNTCEAKKKLESPIQVDQLLAIVPECLPHRYGVFSLWSVLSLLSGTAFLWEQNPTTKKWSLTSLGLPVIMDALGAVLYLCARYVQSSFQVKALFSQESPSSQLHIYIVTAHLAIYILFLLPSLVMSYPRTTASSLAVVSVLVGYAGSSSYDFEALFVESNFRSINSFILSAGTITAIISGYTAAVMSFLLSSVLMNVHPEIFK